MFDHVHNLKYLRTVRKELRNKLTKQEAVLWSRLKNGQLGHKFRRQHSVGNFILDFYCASKLLAIELDGSQHLDATEYDKERTDYLNSLEIKVVRFWNNEIDKNLEEVLKIIKERLESTTTPSSE